MTNNLIFKEKEHEYWVDGIRYPCVTDILREGGFVDFSNVRTTTLEASRKFGEAVHKMTAYYDLGTLDIDILDPNLMPYLEGYKKFLKDFGSFKADEIEQHLYSNMWKFTGTPDRFRRFNGVLFELKSGVMLPSAELQSAGYEVLIEENLGIKIKERFGVQIIQGDYKIHPYKNTSDRSVFLGLVAAFHWKLNHNLLKEVVWK